MFSSNMASQRDLEPVVVNPGLLWTPFKSPGLPSRFGFGSNFQGHRENRFCYRL